MSKNRRRFLKMAGLGTAGALATLSQLWGKASTPLQSALSDLTTNDTTESFWETVQSQFQFAEGLMYFRYPRRFSVKIYVGWMEG